MCNKKSLQVARVTCPVLLLCMKPASNALPGLFAAMAPWKLAEQLACASMAVASRYTSTWGGQGGGGKPLQYRDATSTWAGVGASDRVGWGRRNAAGSGVGLYVQMLYPATAPLHRQDLKSAVITLLPCAMHCSAAQHSTAQHSTAQHSTAQHSAQYIVIITAISNAMQ